MTIPALLGHLVSFTVGAAAIWFLPKLKAWLAGEWAKIKSDLADRL